MRRTVSGPVQSCVPAPQVGPGLASGRTNRQVGRWPGVNIWGSRRQDQGTRPVHGSLCTAKSQALGWGPRHLAMRTPTVNS